MRHRVRVLLRRGLSTGYLRLTFNNEAPGLGDLLFGGSDGGAIRCKCLSGRGGFRRPCVERRWNETHVSKTDADAKLARKGSGKEAKLSCSGNLLVENRNGLIVDADLLEANGRAERDAALLMLEQVPGAQRVTVGGDKGFDTAEFAAECRHMHVTPHVAQNTARAGGSAIDARTTRHAGYAVSQKKRKRIEECFGWLKDIALLRKLKHRGLFKVGWIFTFAAAAYNLVRLRKLIPIPAAA